MILDAIVIVLILAFLFACVIQACVLVVFLAKFVTILYMLGKGDLQNQAVDGNGYLMHMTNEQYINREIEYIKTNWIYAVCWIVPYLIVFAKGVKAFYKKLTTKECVN